MPESNFSKDLVRLYLGGCIGLVIVIAIGIAVVARATRGCDPVVRNRVVAPDSRSEAILWGYDCGWAKKGMSAVAIGGPGDPISKARPALIVMDTGAVRLLTNRSVAPRLLVEWLGADTLVIRFDPLARVVSSRPVVRNVYIRVESIE